MDLLAGLLQASGVRGTLGARIDGGEAWGWWAGASPSAAFHAVTAGTAWLGIPGRPAVQLLPGDVVLLPAGAEHVLASDPDALARTTSAATADAYRERGPGVVAIGTGPARAHILCAHFEHDPAVSRPLLSVLPELVHLPAHQPLADGLDDTVRLLSREMSRPQPASSVVLNRLVDIFLVQVLRAWLADHDDVGPSWVGALEDPVVGQAVARLHEEPARSWTTASLAREVSVSRATLSRRFPAVVGETPAAYLTRRRMDLAAVRLRDSEDPLDVVAASVGYTSVYAFSRAFARDRSVPPGRFRTAARSQTTTRRPVALPTAP